MLPPFSEYEADRAMMACQVQASTPGQKSAQDLLKKALLPAQGMERYVSQKDLLQSSRDILAMRVLTRVLQPHPFTRTDSGG
jgi:hypothetical protein